jgi:hypothetical protein
MVIAADIQTSAQADEALRPIAGIFTFTFLPRVSSVSASSPSRFFDVVVKFPETLKRQRMYLAIGCTCSTYTTHG